MPFVDFFLVLYVSRHASRHCGNLKMEAYNEGLRKRKGAPNRETKTGGVSSTISAQGMLRDLLGSAFPLLAVGLEQCEPTTKTSSLKSLPHTHTAVLQLRTGREKEVRFSAWQRPSNAHRHGTRRLAQS